MNSKRKFKAVRNISKRYFSQLAYQSKTNKSSELLDLSNKKTNTNVQFILKGEGKLDIKEKNEITQKPLTSERALFRGRNLKIKDTIFVDEEYPLGI